MTRKRREKQPLEFASAGSFFKRPKTGYAAALIEQAAQKLEEGDIALIILAEETKEDVLDHALVKYNTVVVRYDADVIAKELEEAEKIRDELARQAHEALRASEEKGE